jgi:hypothetical protein
MEAVCEYGKGGIDLCYSFYYSVFVDQFMEVYL